MKDVKVPVNKNKPTVNIKIVAPKETRNPILPGETEEIPLVKLNDYLLNYRNRDTNSSMQLDIKK